MTINDRVKAVRTEKGKSMEEFGKILNVSRPAISMIESGKNNVSERIIADIVREFGVNELWLRTGEGEMFKTATRNEEISKFFYDVLKMEDEAFQKRFVAALASCTPEMWDAARKFIDDLSKK